VLRSVGDDLHGLTSSHGRSAYKRLIDYLAWASKASNLLRRQISASDLDQLILTRRYELLLTGVGGLVGSEISDAVNDLVGLEVDERIAAFEEAATSLEAQINQWSGPGVFVLPDTSFYMRHDKLEEADFAPLMKVWEDPIHVLVPIVVVDELDSLKQSKGDGHIRWRAGYTLAVLDRVFATTTRAQLRAEDFSAIGKGGIPRGQVTIELLLDPPGHVRLPINDDEIVDRAVAAQSLAARPVTVLTYDTGQSMRARLAGLQAVKLTTPIGPEPAAK
jgi:hypothetical protein